MNYTKAIHKNKIYQEQLSKLYKYVSGNSPHFNGYSLMIPFKYLIDLTRKYANPDEDQITMFTDNNQFDLTRIFMNEITDKELKRFHIMTARTSGYSHPKDAKTIIVNTSELGLDCCDQIEFHFYSAKINPYTHDHDVEAPKYLFDGQGSSNLSASTEDTCNDLKRYIATLQLALRLKIIEYKKCRKAHLAFHSKMGADREKIHNGPYSWRKIFGTDDKVHTYHDIESVLGRY